MLTANVHKKFTACGDAEAEMLLENVLQEISATLSGTQLCVVLGGSYGRGDGGVRLDRNNGILYNDLDFFVFARNYKPADEKLLKEIAEKYEHLLKVDVDFSRIMSVQDIKNNASRLMMQELKRGYSLVCGEDLLAEYLEEIPAEKLPFSEACRLLLNRGMGLLLAGEKISSKSDDTDFILRNIYKAILGAGDAVLIASGKYHWKLDGRLELIEKMDIPEAWKNFYREAVAFKRAPNRVLKADMTEFWQSVKEFFQFAILQSSGAVKSDCIQSSVYAQCCRSREVSLKNFLKYCIKSRSLPLSGWKNRAVPAVAFLLADVYEALNVMPSKIDRQGKLYRHWLIFN